MSDQHLAAWEWWGNVQRVDNEGAAKGLELQNIVEGGEPFERLIDHPSRIEHVHRYCGEVDSYVEGLFIDECFASIRRQGGYLGVHSGGYRGAVRGQYRYNDGVFRYGVCWGATRYGYRYSDELLERLNPAGGKILQPVPPRLPPTAG